MTSKPDSRDLSYPGFMVYCGLVAALTSLSTGYVIGSPNVPETAIRGVDGHCGENPYTIVNGFPNCFKFSDLLWGFAVGSFCLGALAGGLTGGDVQNRFGRKRTMFIANLFFILGALLLGLTYHQAMFIIGRMVIGFACGLGGVVAPSYLGEVSTVKGRGTMGTMYQLLIVVGILLSNCLGLGLSTPPLWRVLLAINGIPALVQLFLLPALPESPRWLVSKNRLPEAQVALQKLRGSEADIDREFDEMVLLLLGRHTTISKENGTEVIDSEKSIENNKNTSSYSIPQLFKSECNKLAILGIALHFLQQACGINGLIYYSTSFLGAVFGADNSKYLTCGLSAVNLLATIAGVYLIDRLGRRTLLMISFGGLTISCIILVIGGYTDLGVLVVVGVFLYTASFAVGLGPIPWLLLSELLPTYALSPASSVATGVNWGSNFVIGLIFPTLNKGLGHGTFILFAAVTCVGFVYTWFLVPETRGRPVEEILKEAGVGPRRD